MLVNPWFAVDDVIQIPVYRAMFALFASEFILFALFALFALFNLFDSSRYSTDYWPMQWMGSMSTIQRWHKHIKHIP